MLISAVAYLEMASIIYKVKTMLEEEQVLLLHQDHSDNTIN